MRALAFAADVGEQARASRGESGLGAHRPVQSRSARQVRASIPAACLHKDHWELDVKGGAAVNRSSKVRGCCSCRSSRIARVCALQRQPVACGLLRPNGSPKALHTPRAPRSYMSDETDDTGQTGETDEGRDVFDSQGRRFYAPALKASNVMWLLKHAWFRAECDHTLRTRLPLHCRDCFDLVSKYLLALKAR